MRTPIYPPVEIVGNSVTSSWFWLEYSRKHKRDAVRPRLRKTREEMEANKADLTSNNSLLRNLLLGAEQPPYRPDLQNIINAQHNSSPLFYKP